jgi:DNA-binding transcriptional MerR regulator
VNAVSNEDASLSIGDLAERTGVSAATLRVWESRHGFPVPHRRESGHRRYDDDHVAVVRDVVRRRDEGVRLDVAIEQARAASRQSSTPPAAAPGAPPPGAPSVYARLRHAHPGLQPQRLTKATLLGLSWAIEDEFASRAQRAHLFGAFQRVRHYRSAEARWNDLARTMRTTLVFADFPETAAVERGRPTAVAIGDDHPMRREWAVVCDSDELPVALTAWELPGQRAVADLDRVFETVWTVEHAAVRDAALVCAQVAVECGVPGAAELVDDLPTAAPRHVDLTQVTSLFNRVVAYVDGRVTRHP